MLLYFLKFFSSFIPYILNYFSFQNLIFKLQIDNQIIFIFDKHLVNRQQTHALQIIKISLAQKACINPKLLLLHLSLCKQCFTILHKTFMEILCKSSPTNK
ncbi:hypothetical protein HPMG_01956 [Helicobacter pullorum MIT 98-5489]|uniref:Uncharacterized protein n=1 Tax=Helicobacter pullorum MIT 98-5489 TaxID=537972 RepID=C5F2K5_9HELI|nr:hypothetical protein HPMG_01956 [Helicobacter pullorum MIT 98-5489]